MWVEQTNNIYMKKRHTFVRRIYEVQTSMNCSRQFRTQTTRKLMTPQQRHEIPRRHRKQASSEKRPTTTSERRRAKHHYSYDLFIAWVAAEICHPWIRCTSPATSTCVHGAVAAGGNPFTIHSSEGRRLLGALRQAHKHPTDDRIS